MVHRRVPLSLRVEYLAVGEHGVEAEGSGLVGDDGHDPVPEASVPGQIFYEADERHGRGDSLLAGPGLDGGEVPVGRHVHSAGQDPPFGEESA